MQVTDMHVQLLHGFLADDPDAVNRAREQAGNLNPLAPLMQAAFGIVARRAFAPSWTMPRVVQFAARARIENAGNPAQFGALDAERELRRVFGDQVPPPRSYEAAGAAMMCMLHVLVADLELDDAGLADLLAQARADADRALARATQ
jgi:hypothetical protein